MYTLELLPPIFAVTCRYVRPINRKHEAVETTIRIGDLLLEDLAQKVVGISSEYIGFQPVDENGNPLTFQGRRVRSHRHKPTIWIDMDRQRQFVLSHPSKVYETMRRRFVRKARQSSDEWQREYAIHEEDRLIFTPPHQTSVDIETFSYATAQKPSQIPLWN